MKVICAWCQSTIAAGDPLDLTHGICQECAFTFAQERGKGIRQLLQGTDVPYVVVDSDAVVVDANDFGLAALKKSRSEVVNQRGGVVIQCERSACAEGCGRSAQCDACVFRATILRTFQDGRSRFGVVSEHPVMGSCGTALFKLRFSTAKVSDAVVITIEHEWQSESPRSACG
jgi:hypothetical protein